MRAGWICLAGALAGCSNNAEDLGFNDAGGGDLPDAMIIEEIDAGTPPDSGSIHPPPVPSARCLFIRGGGTGGAPLAGELCVTVIDEFYEPVPGAQVTVTCGATTLEGTTSAHGHVELSDPCLSGSIDVRAEKGAFSQTGVLGLQVDAVTIPFRSDGRYGNYGSAFFELSGVFDPTRSLSARNYQSEAVIDPEDPQRTEPLKVVYEEPQTVLLTQSSTSGMGRYGIAVVPPLQPPEDEITLEVSLDRNFSERLHVRGRSLAPEYDDRVQLTVRLKDEEPDTAFTRWIPLDEDQIIPIFSAEDAETLHLGALYVRSRPYQTIIGTEQWMRLDVEPGTVIDGDELVLLDPPGRDGLRPPGAGARQASCEIAREPRELNNLWVLDDRAIPGCMITAYDGEGFDPNNVRFYDVLRARRSSSYRFRFD